LKISFIGQSPINRTNKKIKHISSIQKHEQSNFQHLSKVFKISNLNNSTFSRSLSIMYRHKLSLIEFNELLNNSKINKIVGIGKIIIVEKIQ
jgi:hypothetical protein